MASGGGGLVTPTYSRSLAGHRPVTVTLIVGPGVLSTYQRKASGAEAKSLVVGAPTPLDR